MAHENGIKQDDLWTMRDFAELLRKEPRVTFGNDSRYARLLEQPNGEKAFAFAWFAVFGEELTPNQLAFMVSGVQAAAFYQREIDAGIELAAKSEPVESTQP